MTQPTRVILEYADGSQAAYTPEQVLPPPPDPPPQPPRTNIGINLPPLRYWTSDVPFVDLGKTRSPWQWCPNVGTWNSLPPFPTDANGWPTSVPASSYAAGVIDLKQGHANGPYRVMFDGDSVTVDGQSANTTGTATIDKRSAEQRILMRVKKPTQRLAMLGPNTDGSLWAQPFVDRCRKFAVLRMMDWAQTNADRQINWDTRVTPSWYTQADREVAIEYQIDCAKAAGSGIWFNIHHRADDAYVRNAAQLFATHWDKTKPLYLEWSNEVWNGQFPVYQYAVARSPKTKSPIEYALTRTAEIARIFRETGVQVIAVVGGQAVNPGHFQYVLNQVGGLSKEIDAIGIAPYFGGFITDSARTNTTTIDPILSDCEHSIAQNEQYITQWVQLANKYGVVLAGYEGGQHLAASYVDQANPTIVNNYIAANRHPRMYDLYRTYLKQWDDLTNKSLMCLFNSVYQPNKAGSWGLMEYEGQPLSSAHKYRAVLDHMGVVS
jgi:hypothetical protein